MLFELSQYRTRPGQRDNWVKYLEEVIGPFQTSKGMTMAGSWVGEKEDDRVVWIRRFEGEAERERLYNEVNESDEWKDKIAPAIPEMMDRVLMVVVSAGLASAQAKPPNGSEPAARSGGAPYATGPSPFKTDDAGIQLALDRATEVSVVHDSLPPGGSTTWHLHPDAVFVTIIEGAMTLYYGDDPSCTPTVMRTGDAFFEQIGRVHIARNESSTEPLSWYATHIGVPNGVPAIVDQPIPGNCPF
jgi:quercetin dioxygenase-like cupin family protein